VNLSDLDPNLVTGALSLVVGLAGWLWSKARGERTRDLSELLQEHLIVALDDALDDLDTSAAIELRLRAVAGDVVRGLGFDPTKHEQTIRVAVQRVLVEANKRLTLKRRNLEAAKKLPAQAGELAAAAQRIADKLGKLPPDKPIDTIAEARAAGIELYEGKAGAP
jgi:hypothetical protein